MTAYKFSIAALVSKDENDNPTAAVPSSSKADGVDAAGDESDHETDEEAGALVDCR
jgi:hypothetical protein